VEIFYVSCWWEKSGLVGKGTSLASRHSVPVAGAMRQHNLVRGKLRQLNVAMPITSGVILAMAHVERGKVWAVKAYGTCQTPGKPGWVKESLQLKFTWGR
jgi:hypothetical protein